MSPCKYCGSTIPWSAPFYIKPFCHFTETKIY